MYDRTVDDRVLTFRVSGKLWMRSLVMGDAETESEWSHLLGRAMAGPLKGKTLDPIITDMVTWEAWHDEHPGTTVLDMSRTSNNYTREFYRDPTRFVFGFDLAGKAWALPLAKMMDKPVHSFRIGDQSLLATFDTRGAVTHLFHRRLGQQVLEFSPVDAETMKDTQTGSHWKIKSGEAISGPMKGKSLKQRVGIMSFRKAWQNFFPESQDVEF